jgi:hypothetical protein
MRRALPTVAVLAAGLGFGCGSEEAAPRDSGPLSEVAAETQRAGDAALGYAALVNENYVSCGIPWTAYSKVFGPAPESERLPGREGKNAEVPYHQTVITTPSGVEAVTQNCLICHAGRINGQLVIGLGAADLDFTSDQTKLVGLAEAFLTDPAEIAELERFGARRESRRQPGRDLVLASRSEDLRLARSAAARSAAGDRGSRGRAAVVAHEEEERDVLRRRRARRPRAHDDGRVHAVHRRRR